MSGDAGDLIRAAIRVGRTCHEDGLLRLVTRCWTGTLWLTFDARSVVFRFDLGNLVDVVECQNDLKHDEGHFGFSASATSWRQVLLARASSDSNGGSTAWVSDIVRTGHRGTYWQYHRAAGRLFDLLGEELDARRNSWTGRKSFSRSS